MERKQSLFIYDRKEMLVLVLLALAVATFAFTLGVHLGKRVGVKLPAAPNEVAELGTLPDKVPNRQDLHEQSRNAPQVTDEVLSQALHDEVARTGVKLDVQRQIDLPKETRGKTTAPKSSESRPAHDGHGAVDKAPAGGHSATSEDHAPAPVEQANTGGGHESGAAPKKAAGKFTIQVGSFESEEEARERQGILESQGFKAFVRPAEIKGKGKWFRLYVGSFATKEESERNAARFKAQGAIQSYIISKMPE